MSVWGLKNNIRTQLIHWLLSVCNEYDCTRTTFQSTVYLLDLYVNQQSDYDPSKLNVIMFTCLLISSKKCGPIPLLMNQIIKITKSQFSEDQIIDMEIMVLSQISWNLSFITINEYVGMFATRWDIFLDTQDSKIALFLKKKKTYFK